MPFRTFKTDAADTLTLAWVMHVKDYKLTLDRNRCVGCQICTLACPKEAIKTTIPPKAPGEKAPKPKVDIDLKKCNFCAICDVTCPYGAIQVTQNGVHYPAVLAKESYPQLIREVNVNPAKCDKACFECEETCPFKLIKITKITWNGKPLTSIDELSPSERSRIQLVFDIKKDACPTCTLCEKKCPSNAIKVKKAFDGSISIYPEKCPVGCHDCQDVCPIPGTLTLNSDGKIQADPSTCTFCGACKNICPVPEALSVKRTQIHHAPVHSGTWNKTLERITSHLDAAKEIGAQAAMSRKTAVEKRFQSEKCKKEYFST